MKLPNEEQVKLRRLVVGGDLPCSKEEAAALAGIQLRLEESWGRPFEVPPAPPSPQELTLRPISEDKSGSCTMRESTHRGDGADGQRRRRGCEAGLGERQRQ
ncbi:hypothetical protein B566_EDAN005116, partial [Ephemera danica]